MYNFVQNLHKKYKKINSLIQIFNIYQILKYIKLYYYDSYCKKKTIF